MSNEITTTGYDKQFYPQIRAVLGAENAPDTVLDTAISYCQAAGLDVMRKPIAIISYGGKHQIVFTIQAITTIASRAGWAGSDEIQYGPMIKHGSVEVPEWGSQTVYKIVSGHRCAFTGPKVYFRERAQSNQNWTKQPMAMFNKTILAAALRIAFPEALAHAMEADEVYQPVVSVDNTGIETLKQVPASIEKAMIVETEEVAAEEVQGTVVLEPVAAQPACSENELLIIINAMNECKTKAELDEVRAMYGDVYAYTTEQKTRLKKLVEGIKGTLK
jgi:hypothetical protein